MKLTVQRTPSVFRGVLMTLFLGLAPTTLMAQDGVDEDMISTDGMIQYGDLESMWQTIGERWSELSVKASNRWDKLEEDAVTNTGGQREQLVNAVAEGYDMDELRAEQEVDSWAMSLNVTD